MDSMAKGIASSDSARVDLLCRCDTAKVSAQGQHDCLNERAKSEILKPETVIGRLKSLSKDILSQSVVRI